MSFFPLDRKILKSSIYLLGSPVEWKVWTHLMLTADPRTGVVDQATWVIARDTNLTEASVEDCLTAFARPDPYSRTKVKEGARITREGTKITLLNYLAHRDRDHSTPRVARYRAKKRKETAGVTVKRRSTVTETTDTDTDTDTTNGDGLRIAPPPASPLRGVQLPPVPVVPPWSQEACDDWIARFQGTAPGGTIGRHLKPLVEKNGWPAVRAAWRAYLHETEAQFANPARFAATYGTWRRTIPAPPAPAEPQEALPELQTEALDLFEAMKVRLSGVLPLQTHATWVRPVFGQAFKDGALVLVCPSREHAGWLKNHADQLRAAAAELDRPQAAFRAIVQRPGEDAPEHTGSVR